jgi:hypothetical protein
MEKATGDILCTKMLEGKPINTTAMGYCLLFTKMLSSNNCHSSAKMGLLVFKGNTASPSLSLTGKIQMTIRMDPLQEMT